MPKVKEVKCACCGHIFHTDIIRDTGVMGTTENRTMHLVCNVCLAHAKHIHDTNKLFAHDWEESID